ncbi:MAG: serine/threonine protein kinase [Planctomycetota bacterium]|nr:MAG: serine/threonine protein kinase [Planctomycetota bacterium]
MDSDRLSELGDQIEAFMAECLQLPGSKRSAQLEAFCRDHPELAEEVKARFQILTAMGFADSSEDEFPDQLGDFQLLERIGGGGMGVVYRARQISLGREVALKLIRPGQLYFPKARERFRREVEVIAGLQHPGIVTVHTYGEEQGLPFFAMEYVPGATLAQILADLRQRAPESLLGPDFARTVLQGAGVDQEPEDCPWAQASWTELAVRSTVQIARALQHAHDRGALHRDVKPSNVLVTPEGQARLFDFGLTLPSGNLRLTESGAQLGTLFYMSPEQVRGERSLDARSDLYSLGVTLYEMLALQVPFQGDDRSQTESQILNGRPFSLQSRNRRIPEDLEVVVAKAMDADPAHRYATVAAFAQDLENVLSGQPILARPPSKFRQFRLFIRRHRVASVAAAGLLLASVAVPSALWIQSRLHATELKKSWDLEKEAKQAAVDRADEFQAIQEFLLEVLQASDPELAQGQVLDAREILRRSTQAIEQRFVDKPNIRRRVLEVLGILHQNLGSYDEAAEMFEKLADSLENSDDLAALASALVDTADAFRMGHRFEKAFGIYQKALDILEENALLEQAGIRSRALTGLASIYTLAREFEKADGFFQQCLEVMEPIREQDQQQWAKVNCFYAQNKISLALEKPDDERQELLESALELLLEGLVILEQEPEGQMRDIMNLSMRAGITLKLLGRWHEARNYYERTLDWGNRIFPDSDSQAVVKVNFAGFLETGGRRLESLPYYRAALNTFDQLEGGGLAIASLRMQSMGNYAGTLMRAEAYEQASEVYASYRPMEKQAKVSDRIRATTWRNHGECLARAGEYDQAKSALETAVKIWRDAFGDEHRIQIPGWVELTRQQLEQKQWQAAQENLARIRQLSQGLPEDHPELTSCLFSEGLLAAKTGDTAEALAKFQAVAENPKLADHDHYKQRAKIEWGILLSASGKAKEAVPLLESALEACRYLMVAEGPTRSRCRQALVEAWTLLGSEERASAYRQPLADLPLAEVKESNPAGH